MAFPITHWSVLAQASLSGDDAGRAALERLCADYRPPVVAFLRSLGYGAEDAEDLSQEFFLSLLRSRLWKRADRERGRFRTFLLGALMHVAGHARERNSTAKRGGGIASVSLDALADGGVEFPEPEPLLAGRFDHEWARSVVADVMSAIENEYSGGRAAEFAVLRAFLPGASAPPTYAEAASRLGLTEAGVTTKVHRLRADFRDRLRAAVARTVSAPHEIDAELAHLRAAWSAVD